MNRTKLPYLLLAAIPALFFFQSCTNNTKVGTESSVPGNSPTGNQGQSAQPAGAAQDLQKSAPQFDEKKSAKLTDAAKFIAGMKVDASSPIASLQNTRAWSDHASYLDSAWGKLDAQQLSKIRQWSQAELASLNASSPTIFYPFSGPDFLYAYSFFPKGSEYIMAGLEPVGDIPELENIPESQLDKKLRSIDTALYAILQLSFFRTNDMKEDLAEKGVIPILFVFLARTNNQILDAQHISLDKTGKIQAVDGAQKDGADQKLIPGVKISFLPAGETQPRTLYYFSADLSNDALDQTAEFNTFVKQLQKPVTYLKAASYLMYRDSFSSIRNLILEQSNSLLQDDSGMPVSYFDSSKWDLKFYGNYTRPIPLFSVREQPDLRKIYQSDKSIKPLDFGIGYQFELGQSNLMLALSKQQPQSKP
ncbi:hypothetical protein [Kamptonema formosum]|uniref:hypothetical protein n=1 Tax=Kamptonema formosum TaxID=331992 RepID=UPI00034D353F|nr:hypothetical protein [Oscillatoria sp. PCC 10802]